MPRPLGAKLGVALGLAGLLAATSAVRAADIPGDKTTKATLPFGLGDFPGNPDGTGAKSGDFDTPTDSDWYRVRLARGTTYTTSIFEGGVVACHKVELRDRTGKLLKSSPAGGEFLDPGIEFKAPYEGLFFIAARACGFDDEPPDGNGYSVRITEDCAADKTTDCRLVPGKTLRRFLVFSADVDWVKVALKVGQSYTFQAEDVDSLLAGLEVDLVDAKGGVVRESDCPDGGCSLQTIARFVPESSGDYFIRVRNRDLEYVGPFRLTMTQP